MNRSFTDSDRQYVKENYGKLSSREIAKELNRTSSSIRGLAARLGISRCRDGSYHRPWKTTEIAYMREFYPLLGSKLCKILNRTVHALVGCARKWGIRKSRSRPVNWIDLRRSAIPNGITAIEFIGVTGGHVHPRWLLECHCGNLTTATATQVMHGHKKSCGCLNFTRIPGPYFDARRRHQRFSIRMPRC